MYIDLNDWIKLMSQLNELVVEKTILIHMENMLYSLTFKI